MLRAAGQGHLEFSPFEEIEFDTSSETAAILPHWSYRRSSARNFDRRSAKTRKVADPTQVHPRRRRSLQIEHPMLGRIEYSCRFGRTVHGCEISAHSAAHRSHGRTQRRLAHGRSASGKK